MIGSCSSINVSWLTDREEERLMTGLGVVRRWRDENGGEDGGMRITVLDSGGG